jgi:hypothetical protein
MLELSDRWAETLRTERETGMGYTVCTIGLTDGCTFERVVIVGGVVTQCDGQNMIPFGENEMAWIKATHDKTVLKNSN